MRLLLTRAADDAARTREKLEAAGHRAMIAPLLRILPLPATWPDGCVDGVLATSGNAFATLPPVSGPPVSGPPVSGLPASTPQALPTPEARRIMPLLLVGRRTLDCARANGFLGAATVAANATVLALGLGKLPVRPRRIVYLAGRDRKPDIEAAMRVMKQPFELIETYEAQAVETMDAAAVLALRAGTIDGVLHFSQRSADLFLSLARSAKLDPGPLRHICLSDEVAAPFRGAGCSHVAVAEAPNEAALLACLDSSQA